MTLRASLCSGLADLGAAFDSLGRRCRGIRHLRRVRDELGDLSNCDCLTLSKYVRTDTQKPDSKNLLDLSV